MVADALGVPASGLALKDAPLWGGDFKFRDYESALEGFSRPLIPLQAGISLDELISRSASPSRDIISSVTTNLMEGWKEVLEHISHR